ncbi:SMI1/KNR4 family protein [Paenibacillus sp. LPE1-1-1.1]|uniref:SMI1/KNR4 family protein n=1 Tax=Paenibacillus sp. LPE1-1-1.1 TaxID=3135230 RepID=UPI00343266FB
MIDSLVELTLDAFKKRLNEDNSLLVQREWGYTENLVCYFFPAATIEEIEEFQNEHNIKFPIDFKLFLMLHNGVQLFCHPKYGDGFEIFGLNEIYQHYIEYNYKDLIPDGWFPIGSDNGDMLFINSKDYKDNQRENSYLYWSNKLFVDNAKEIGLNFERWFERFLMYNGDLFWVWGKEKTYHYYGRLKQHLINIEKYHK